MNNKIFLKKLIFYIIIFFLIFGSFSVKAQEILTGLQTNPRIKQLALSKSKNKAAKEEQLLELPFIDDFSKTIGFPDSSLWKDNNVFINQSYAYDPLSIGVATFDAIDGTGAMYPNASSFVFGADTLTSKSINLYYPGDKTIFLSFYYQPGGLGDSPETKDSLILEFLSNDTIWQKRWHVVFKETDSVLTEKHFYEDTTIKTVKGDTITKLKHTFQRVIIPVSEEQYLDSNFQFRFRNYASITTSTSNESKASNADHWNIDYLILNKDRNINDTIGFDLAMCKPMNSLLKTYESIPYPHLERAFSFEMEDSIEVTYRNLTDTLQAPEKFFEIEGLMGVPGTESFEGGVITEVKPMLTQIYRKPLPYSFPINRSIDSAIFEIRAFFDNNLSEDIHFRWNDTARFRQNFFNYYAYDDGTAENGYGIIGEGTERAMVAMRFNSYKKDTLRAIQIFFNQVVQNANQFNFKLHVWNETNGKPGNIIYTQEGLKPQNEEELNKFTTYILDSIVILENSFFIGWQKELSTSEMLNVGFDVNRINNDKLYYNFSGTWVRSQYEGTIMIRPVFGKEINVSTGTEPNPRNQYLEYTIYPNPANDVVNINIDNNFIEDYRYTIFDIYGRVYLDETSQQSSFNVSNLNSGIYFIRISDSKGINTTKKFMIVR
ncbi:MAG TPA: hypothetical protein DCG75_12575 [Bacteroidales bacterium]|nr:hypothetical protein [Bacteroidales bacterium]